MAIDRIPSESGFQNDPRRRDVLEKGTLQDVLSTGRPTSASERPREKGIQNTTHRGAAGAE